MKKIRDDVINAFLFAVLLPAIVVASVKTMIRIRKEMTYPNPDMWE
jgi:hypothetical protein